MSDETRIQINFTFEEFEALADYLEAAVEDFAEVGPDAPDIAQQIIEAQETLAADVEQAVECE